MTRSSERIESVEVGGTAVRTEQHSGTLASKPGEGSHTPTPIEDVERASFRAALATILELPLAALPELCDEPDPATGWSISRWLGRLGLGLVPVADPAPLPWAGPWLGASVWGANIRVALQVGGLRLLE
jgi:hypothetical protein